LKFLVKAEHCIQASLWWRSIYAIEQAPLRQVASEGSSEVLSFETEELLYRQLMRTDAPEPGFVLHHVEKGSVYALPLYVEDEVRGALFLVSKTELSQQNLPHYSRFLGQIFGTKLERKFLAQTLNEWVFYSPEPIMISDARGVICRVNLAWRKLLCYLNPADEPAPMLWDCVYPQDLARFKKLYENLQPGSEGVFEGRCINRQGEAIHVSWKISRSPDNDRVYHVIRDVSHKHDLSQRLEQAYALAKMGTWEMNVEKGRVYWSQVTREIHEEDDPKFKPVLEKGINYYHPDDRPVIEEAVQKCLKSAESWDLQLRIITAKGNERWVRTLGEGEFEDGKCKNLFGIFMDIDAQKRAELAQEKQAHMLALLNRVHQQFLSKHWQNFLPEALQTYTEALGIDLMMYVHRSQMPAASVQAFLPYNTLPPSLRAQEELLAGSHSLLPGVFTSFQVSELPHNHLRAYFKSLSLATVSMLSVFSRGMLQGSVVMGHRQMTYSEDEQENKFSFIQSFAYSLSQALANQQSLEELKVLNAELAENMNALAYSNQELEQFAYIASHDLQEPLRMVTSFLNQLEKKYAHALDEKAHRYIFFATDGARRMRQIILDLLEYSRLGKPEQMLYEKINAEDLMSEVKVLLRQKIQETRADITCDLPVTFTAPRIPLRQVLQNLVENALKYMTPEHPPQIHIVVKEIAEDWLFSVQDNGIGMGSEYFEKIFVIFQRLHGKDVYEGTGVGLALCKKIIEQCHGKIWVESVLGQGSTFFFKIPKGEPM
jgi:signal transduction histidine kinase/PAS domain-containing protein